VPEEHLEAYAVLTAMGPTYLWFQLQQLRELGRSFGLPAAEVDGGLAAMATGAVRTLFTSGLSAEEVMDLVPVRPLRDDEEAIRTAYRGRLTGTYQKLVG
jgi:pyrroline-5-carboxylate reductase